MDLLLILNDGPSPEGRSERALQLASALLRAEDAVVRVFLLHDAVSWAAARTRTATDPEMATIVSTLIHAGALVAAADEGMREHEMSAADLVIGAEPAGLSTLAAWCLEADRVLVF